jgi:hypothetical protein
MRGLGVMMANGIACGAGRVAAGLALSKCSFHATLPTDYMSDDNYESTDLSRQ